MLDVRKRRTIPKLRILRSRDRRRRRIRLDTPPIGALNPADAVARVMTQR